MSNTLRDICEFSLENALEINKENFINMIPEDKFIYSDKKELVSGHPPTNLIKYYNETPSEKSSNFGISFGVRKGGNFSCIVDIDKPVCTILYTYGRMPRLFLAMKKMTKYILGILLLMN